MDGFSIWDFVMSLIFTRREEEHIERVEPPAQHMETPQEPAREEVSATN